MNDKKAMYYKLKKEIENRLKVKEKLSMNEISKEVRDI